MQRRAARMNGERRRRELQQLLAQASRGRSEEVNGGAGRFPRYSYWSAVFYFKFGGRLGFSWPAGGGGSSGSLYSVAIGTP